jgi:hypothetical protein
MSIQEAPLHDVIAGVLCATRITKITWITFTVLVDTQQRIAFWHHF